MKRSGRQRLAALRHLRFFVPTLLTVTVALSPFWPLKRENVHSSLQKFGNPDTESSSYIDDKTLYLMLYTSLSTFGIDLINIKP